MEKRLTNGDWHKNKSGKNKCNLICKHNSNNKYENKIKQNCENCINKMRMQNKAA